MILTIFVSILEGRDGAGFTELSARGYLLEHLESCGTKIMMRGPIVRQ